MSDTLTVLERARVDVVDAAYRWRHSGHEIFGKHIDARKAFELALSAAMTVAMMEGAAARPKGAAADHGPDPTESDWCRLDEKLTPRRRRDDAPHLG